MAVCKRHLSLSCRESGACGRPSSGYDPLWLPVWVQTEGRVEKSRIWSSFKMEFENCNVAGEKKSLLPG